MSTLPQRGCFPQHTTAEQNPAHQIDALSRAGVQRANIYLDTDTAEDRAMFGVLRSTIYGHLDRSALGQRPRASRSAPGR